MASHVHDTDACIDLKLLDKEISPLAYASSMTSYNRTEPFISTFVPINLTHVLKKRSTRSKPPVLRKDTHRLPMSQRPQSAVSPQDGTTTH